MKVYFIRHGQTTCNAAGWHQGWGPIGLTEKGFAQARETKRLISDIHFDKIYSSDLLRTKQTAEVIFTDEFRAGRIHFDADLREIDTGVFYKKAFSDLYPIYGDEYKRRRQDMDYGIYGGDSSRAIRTRVENFLNRIEADADLDRIAVVAHGGVILAAANIILGVPPELPIGRIPIHVANCSVSVFGYEKGSWSVKQINYTGRIE